MSNKQLNGLSLYNQHNLDYTGRHKEGSIGDREHKTFSNNTVLTGVDKLVLKYIPPHKFDIHTGH